MTFLRARLEDDEQTALAADGDVVVNYVAGETKDNGEPEAGRHIARWLPSRVLAEVEVKRRILDALGDFGDGSVWASTEAFRAEEALRALALPYASHPDYDETWRPA